MITLKETTECYNLRQNKGSKCWSEPWAYYYKSQTCVYEFWLSVNKSDYKLINISLQNRIEFEMLYENCSEIMIFWDSIECAFIKSFML